MEEILHLVLKTYGVVGFIIIVPYIGVLYLWKDNLRLNKKMMELSEAHAKTVDEIGERVTAVQEKRIEDAQTVSSKLVELMQERGSLDRETNHALTRISDMISNAVNNGRHGKRATDP